MNNLEKLPIFKALEKIVGQKAEECRKQCDAEIKKLYEDSGIKKIDLRVNGDSVGSFTATVNKAGFEVTDKPLFDDFALTYGFADEVLSINPEAMQRAIGILRENLDEEAFKQMVSTSVKVDSKWENFITAKGGECYFLDTAELVPGIKIRKESFKSTMVTGCKPDDVIPLINQLPGGINALLLGGGSEENEEKEQ